MSAKPNVLFFITDQHRPDHTGFGGNAIVLTPNLDAIAARAVRFDRAIVANPICMPNRSSIVTGRMPSIHGTRYNGIPLDWGANTFVRVLRENGYRTGLVGKSHFQNIGHNEHVATSAFEGEPQVEARSLPYPPGWDAWELFVRHRRETVEVPEDFYGFDHVQLTTDHSDYCSGHYFQWLLSEGVDPEKLQGAVNALPYEAKSKQVWKTAVPEDMYPTTWVCDRAIDFLDTQATTDDPFFLWCSFPDPHHPFTPPGRYFDLYDPSSIPLPETFGDSHEGSMPHYRRLLENRGRQRGFMSPWAPTEEQFREAAAKEYGMITMIDDAVGRIVARLDSLGIADDTVVIFTSDHGDMFGDHSVMLKAAMHYEGCIRVPLLISRPGAAGSVSSSLVSSLDLGQTILELAGLPEYHGMQGTSLVPLLEDPSAQVRDRVLVEEDEMFDMLGTGRHLRMRTLVTTDARLTLYDGVEHGELFDLDRDPGEIDNLFASPKAAEMRAHLTERLARQLMEVADPSPKPSHMA